MILLSNMNRYLCLGVCKRRARCKVHRREMLGSYFDMNKYNLSKAKILYTYGNTLEEVGQVFGVSAATISRAFNAAGVKIRTKSELARGSKNPAWAGGRVKRKGSYVRIYVGIRQYVGEHRLVMEKHIGRPLVDGEWVHHINENKSDKRIENLKLVTKQTHQSEHLIQSWSKANEQCIDCGTTEIKHAAKGLCVKCYSVHRNITLRVYEIKRDKDGKRIFADLHRKRISQAIIRRNKRIQNEKLSSTRS